MNNPKFATGHGYCLNCGRSLFECECQMNTVLTPEQIHKMYEDAQNATPLATWEIAEAYQKYEERELARLHRHRQLRFALWLVLIALVALIVFNILLSINSYLDTRIAQGERDVQLRSNVLKVMESE